MNFSTVQAAPAPLIEFEDSSNGFDTDRTSSTPEPSSGTSPTSIVISSDSDSQPEGSSKRKKLHHNQKSAKKKAIENDSNEEKYDTLINRALSVIEQPNDELDVFGQFIASEMRQLPNASLRRVVKSEIMKILIHYSTPAETYSTVQNQFDGGFSKETVFVIDELEST